MISENNSPVRTSDTKARWSRNRRKSCGPCTCSEARTCHRPLASKATWLLEVVAKATFLAHKTPERGQLWRWCMSPPWWSGWGLLTLAGSLGFTASSANPADASATHLLPLASGKLTLSNSLGEFWQVRGVAAHRGEAVRLVALKEPSFPTDLGSWERAAVGGWGEGSEAAVAIWHKETKM